MAFGDVYKGQRVLITGHTGFKGSWLASWLIRQGADVRGLSREIPTNPSLFELANLAQHMDHGIGDVCNLDVVRKVIKVFRPRFVFHLAAQALVSISYKDPIQTIATNVMGTANVMEALRDVDWPCTAIMVTSDKCYDNVEQVWGYREIDAMGGKDIYSGSKGAAELVLKSYIHSFFRRPDCTVKVAIARAGNVIGGGDWAVDRIVPDCMRAWTAGERVQIRSPKATRPWQHVLEPLSGYLALGERIARTGRHVGEAYNFGPRAEQNNTVVQVLGELGKIWGFDSTEDAFEIVDDIPFHEAGLLKLNCDKALLELGWEANLSYAECIEMTGSWYRNVLRDGGDAAMCTDNQIARYEALAKERGYAWMRAEA